MTPEHSEPEPAGPELAGPELAGQQVAAASRTRRALSPRAVTILVVAVGLVITGALSWTAWTLNEHNEHRLLEVQTRQAGAVLASTILTLRGPLATAVQVATVSDGNAQLFGHYMAGYLQPAYGFVSATLWKRNGAGTYQPVASVGVEPALSPTSPVAQALVARAAHSQTFLVTSIRTAGTPRIEYAIADPKDPTYVVTAERAIPANRRVPVENNSAFADLDFATYIGPPDTADLATTDLPSSRLPLTGDTATAVVPFGDSSLTLVASPRGQLGGTLGAALPWVLLVGGLLLTGSTAFVAEKLVKRRRDAEDDASTIAGLYGRLDSLYADQRSIAETLQRALLPQYNPEIPNLEIATRYVAGAAGVDIGGDWYSMVALDEHHFGFVVGDVSGRGVEAAVIMARLRFTIRAYLVEGHPAARILEMCSHQLDVNRDGHFATVLVGIGTIESREITLANAGHLNPLIITPEGSWFVPTRLGPPLGTKPVPYEPTTLIVPPGCTFVAFTDGLVERRHEHLDVGLDRLAGAVGAPATGLESLLSRLTDDATGSASEDDIAILAFRWRDVGSDELEESTEDSLVGP
ncbi:MAG: PP2C family protein-serine/threonine phosphatase [Acidimicrobiales bacterium]|jgi:hypothetical protein